MSTVKKENASAALDTVKLAAAVLLLVAGIGAFYALPDYSTLLRVVGLLVVVGIAIALFAYTQRGGELFQFMKGARQEVRKMVWPTRQEALQTTLIVVVLVILVGIFLWLVDMLLGWGVSHIVGGA